VHTITGAWQVERRKVPIVAYVLIEHDVGDFEMYKTDSEQR
jgi:hypothetical protein